MCLVNLMKILQLILFNQMIFLTESIYMVMNMVIMMIISKDFYYFKKQLLELIDLLNLKIDIVHCNDWQSSLVPIFLKYGTQGKLRLGNEKTLLTIHNLAHQGIFDNKKFYLNAVTIILFFR